MSYAFTFKICFNLLTAIIFATVVSNVKNLVKLLTLLKEMLIFNFHNNHN